MTHHNQGRTRSPETRAKMSTAQRARWAERRQRMQSAAPVEPALVVEPAPAVKAQPAIKLPRRARRPDAAELPPAREMARIPTRKQLCELPRTSVTIELWARGQTKYDTVAGRLLQRVTWPLGGVDNAVYRFRLAARLNPELGIPDEVAAAAADQMLRQWRAFRARKVRGD